MQAPRKKRSGSMLCYPFEENRLAKWNPPYLVGPKLDGERGRAVLSSNGLYRLESSTKEIIISVPHINDFFNNLGTSLEFDGELYRHGLTLPQIQSIVSRRVNMHPDAYLIEFHCFDLVIEGLSQLERYEWLCNSFNHLQSPFRLVYHRLCWNLNEVYEAYNYWIGQNYEGIVVREASAVYERKRSTHVMKFKPKRNDWYPIVGWKEEKTLAGKPKGIIGTLLLQGDDETTFGASGMTDKGKALLWTLRDTLVGRIAFIGYQHTSGKNHVPLSATVFKVKDPQTGGKINVSAN